MTLNDIRTRLHAMAEPCMQAFNCSLLPGIGNILGVRIPRLRALAKEVISTGDYAVLYATEPPHSMEENMLRGMLIGYLPKTVDTARRYRLLQDFVPRIDNWSVCDSCCATYKFVRADLELAWDFLQPYIRSNAEYEARFGIVMLINHFVKHKEWAERVAQELQQVQAEGYYATMAAAWCMCELYLQHPELAQKQPAPHKTLRADIATLTCRKLRESQRKEIVIFHNIHA